MRNFLTTVLFLMIAVPAFTQVKLGIKASPVISSNRVNVDGGNADASNDGSGVRLSFGPVADFSIDPDEKYYFTTGLWFTSKRAGISYMDVNSGRLNQVYNLQYLQIPAGIKMYTNEVGLDKKIYFQFGPTLDLKINEKQKSGDASNQVISKFKVIDMDVFVGAGLDYRISESNRLFGGLTYYRGLINAAGKSKNDNLSLKNDMVAIELGIMF